MWSLLPSCHHQALEDQPISIGTQQIHKQSYEIAEFLCFVQHLQYWKADAMVYLKISSYVSWTWSGSANTAFFKFPWLNTFTGHNLWISESHWPTNHDQFLGDWLRRAHFANVSFTTAAEPSMPIASFVFALLHIQLYVLPASRISPLKLKDFFSQVLQCDDTSRAVNMCLIIHLALVGVLWGWVRFFPASRCFAMASDSADAVALLLTMTPSWSVHHPSPLLSCHPLMSIFKALAPRAIASRHPGRIAHDGWSHRSWPRRRWPSRGLVSESSWTERVTCLTDPGRTMRASDGTTGTAYKQNL